MTGSGQKTRLALIGLSQASIQFRQFPGSLTDHVFQVFVDLTQCLLIPLAFGDVHIGTDKTPTHHWRATNLNHNTTGQRPLELMGVAIAQQLHPLVHVGIQIITGVKPPLSVITVDLLDRPPQPNQTIGIIEQLHIGLIPCHHLHVPVDHTDTLTDGLDGGTQQLMVELDQLRGFIHHPHDIIMAAVLFAQQRAHHDSGCRRAHGAGQQALHIAHQVQRGRQGKIFRHMAPLHVIKEQRLGTRITQPALAHFQQLGGGNGGVPHALTPPIRWHIHKAGRLGFVQRILLRTARKGDKRRRIHR